MKPLYTTLDPSLKQHSRRLTYRQREDHRQAKLLGNGRVHGAEGAGRCGHPRLKLGPLRDEGVDEPRTKEGSKNIADNHLDNGRGVVTPRITGHDDIGRNGRGETAGHEHAEKDRNVDDTRMKVAGCNDDPHDGYHRKKRPTSS